VALRRFHMASMSRMVGVVITESPRSCYTKNF